MPLTQIIRQQCKVCGKIAVEESRFKLGKSVIIKLACGHIVNETSLASDDSIYESIVFSDGCKPRKYQIDAVKFAEESNVRCIIADEQGLGKTIETLSLLRIHPEKLLPCIIVCPSTVKLQWMFEIYRICSSEEIAAKDRRFLTQVITSGKERAIPGFQIYIVTYDILKKENLFEYLPDGTIKTIIIDECQRIKNHLSERAKAVQRIGKNTPHIISLSGTPINNHAGEYFTVLNLTKPTLFPHYHRYLENYCETYNNGWGIKVGGIRDLERFQADTKDIIIRRTKADVLTDLPPLDRKFHHVELDRALNKAYDEALKELDEMMYGDSETEFERMTNIIAIYSKMRHITGIGKVENCAEFVTEFLLSTIEENKKIVVFVHHNDVMSMLEMKLNQLLGTEELAGHGKVCVLHAGLSGDERARLVQTFKEDSSRRVMIASTLAAGEGLNLQFCSDAIIFERQWNPANEEQAEGRFHRFGQLNSVSITYFIASGTIDDFFTELVEKKRALVKGALDHKVIQWDQQSLMKELGALLLAKGRKAWSL